jgi:hypothetical protein
MNTFYNPWCGDCVERKDHRFHENGAKQALHLEREHDYQFFTGKPGVAHPDPLEAPYALDQLHDELHRRGGRHTA